MLRFSNYSSSRPPSTDGAYTFIGDFNFEIGNIGQEVIFSELLIFNKLK